MFVACADEGNNERRKETMQDAGENQKPETDKYYIRPKAANDRMKLAQNMGQTVYISGATGFGKTSFVADYLFRRRYEYYSMAESVPEDILRGLSYEKKRIVVVDDLQQLTETVERETARETVEKLAKVMNRKNRVPHRRPPSILTKTLGSVWKMREGPASGWTP